MVNPGCVIISVVPTFSIVPKMLDAHNLVVVCQEHRNT